MISPASSRPTSRLTPRRSTAGLALAATVALIATGCGGGSDDDQSDRSDRSDQDTASQASTPTEEAPTSDTTTDDGGTDPTTGSSDSPGRSGDEPAARAAQAALDAVPGIVVSIDSEDDDGTGNVWSVQLRDDNGEGIELYIDAETGDVVREEPESVPQEAQGSTPKITAFDAIDIALETVPGGAIDDVDLDTELGVVVWDVVVIDGGEMDLTIDAETGEVLHQERDD